jgi:hypothetical protein
LVNCFVEFDDVGVQGKLECGSAAVADRRLVLNPERLAAVPDWMRTALGPDQAAILVDTAAAGAPETNERGGVHNMEEARLVHALLRYSK